ncbi:unnamed protein product [Musa textilis]
MSRSFALPSSRWSQKSRVRRANLGKSHQLFSVPLKTNKTSASTVGFLVRVAGTLDFFPVIPPSPPFPI